MERRTGSAVTHLDRASVAVIILTFTLFVSALLVKGLTHDLFLEAGVLLVSVKLILNGYHMDAHVGRLEERIDEMRGLLQQVAGTPHPLGREREHEAPSPDPLRARIAAAHPGPLGPPCRAGTGRASTTGGAAPQVVGSISE